MTRIEEVIAEIKRLKSYKLNLEEDTEYLRGYDFAIDTIEEFINSLPAEQPSGDLEISIIEYLGHVPENEPEHSETLYTYEQMQEIARHFANWQKQRTIDKACEWLRNNVLEYFDDAGVEISTFTENFISAMEDEQ